ncbi:MAG: hypothetical protein KIS96_12320 [Bauldia sp.]|nr:hypothetical protein [Bauldia sp.]
MAGVVALGAMAASAPAAAQDVPGRNVRDAVPDGFLDFTRRTDGRIHFCLNMASAIVEYDRAVAEAIADSLLVPPNFFEIIDPYMSPYPFDYRFTVGALNLFVGVSNECDALMGYLLPAYGTPPEWLTVTRPYLIAPTVFAVADPAYRRLEDIPPGMRIGTGLGEPGDATFRTYNNTRPASARWRRAVTPSPGDLVNGLLSGEYAGILIWEPGLHLALGGDPPEAGVSLASTPFSVPPLQFSVALPAAGAYVRGLLDQAITALEADGTLRALAIEHGIASAD